MEIIIEAKDFATASDVARRISAALVGPEYRFNSVIARNLPDGTGKTVKLRFSVVEDAQ